MTKDNKNLRADLENRIRFETLISDISARFVRLPFSEVDDEIERALKQVLDFFDVDRCGVLGVHEDKKFAWLTHACFANGVEPVSKEINLAELFPWTYEKVTNGLPVNVGRLTELPSEAQQDRLGCLATGVKSYLCIPLFCTQSIRYLLAIQSLRNERDWPAEFISRLNLLGEIFVNTLERRDANKVLSESESKYRLLFERSSDAIFLVDTTTGRYLDANCATEKLTGRSVDELKHLTTHDLCPKGSMGSIDRLVKIKNSKETIDLGEVEYIHKDGTIRTALLAAVPLAENIFYGIASDITYHKKVQENLIKSRETLRVFTSRLLTIQEEERRRLARELHDDFTQRLSVLAMDMSMLEAMAKTENTQFGSKLKHIRDQIVNLSTDIHDISRQLHPSIIDDLGLGRAIQSECTNFTRKSGVVTNYKPNNIPSTIPRDISVCLFRITQEALRNIQKHACVKEADILLVGGDNSITLTIHDSGVGFDPAIARQTHGLGLFSMQERVQLIQGDFSIDSAPGQGTQIKVVVPLKEIESE